MKDRPLSYWIAVARMGFEDDFHRIFNELGISQAELAKRVGASPAYVSKLLSGAGNLQLATMAKWARAIGAIVQIRLIKEGEEVVRVIDPETAGALDDRQHFASSPAPSSRLEGSSEKYASITQIADYLPAAGGKRVKTAALGNTVTVEAIKRHG